MVLRHICLADTKDDSLAPQQRISITRPSPDDQPGPGGEVLDRIVNRTTRSNCEEQISPSS